MSAALHRLPTLASAILLALPVASCGSADLPPGSIVERHRELLAGEGQWRVLAERTGAPARAGVLTPSLTPADEPGVEATDLPALIMPPPCEVAIAVGPDEDEVTLRTAAGIDLSVSQMLPEDGSPLRVAFEVEVNGERAFETTLEASGRADAPPGRWHAAGGAQGIVLRGGDEIVLRTRHVGEAPPHSPADVRVGFGRLVLERERLVARQRSSPETPNLVLIVMDTLRADRLGCYGHERETSPNLDALAGRGLVFEEAFATSSWTWPATASLLTGLTPAEHGVTSNETGYLAGYLDTLPEALARAGFTTAAFTCNPLIVPAKNYDQGFGTFDHAWRFRKSDLVVPEVLRWLENAGPERFFLYLHLVDPHSPHRPRAEDLARLGGARPADFPPHPDPERYPDYDPLFDGATKRLLRGEGRGPDGEPRPGQVVSEEHARWLQDAYDASVATGDHWTGQVLDALERLDLAQSTVVAFTSDHGEELLDHGLLAHGHTLHRELVRVPLILAGPGLPRGARVETPVSNRNLAPTLARLGGVRLAGLREFVDLTRAEDVPWRPVLFGTDKGWWNGHRAQVLRGLRSREWVLHVAPAGADWGAESGPEGGQVRLYDVREGSAEMQDVSGEHSEVAATLREQLEATIAEGLRRRTDLGPAAYGAATQAQLRGIGYVDAPDEDEDE